MKRRALIAILTFGSLLAASAPVQAQNLAPADCANPPQPGVLHILKGFAGKPVTFKGGGGFYPGCDEYTDTYTVNISWGDGTSSPATPFESGRPGVFTFTERHVYTAPGSYSIDVTQTNNRTGVSRSSGLLTEITSDFFRVPSLLNVKAGRRFGGSVATVTPGFFPLNYNRVTIAWGDGRSSPGTVVFERGGAISIRGSHRWEKPAKRKRRIVVTLEVALSPTVTGTVTVVRPLKVGPPASG